MSNNALVKAESNMPMETGMDISAQNELAVTSSASFAFAEMQAAVILAKRFPRDMTGVFQSLMKTCTRKTFAEKATYAFPRGGATVKGPSVNLLRAAGQAFRNIRWGLNVLRDDDNTMAIEGWAWDIENNIKVTAQDNFQKLIYRKKEGWIKPDERDLRELVNRRGAILVRNCLSNIIPRDLVEDAMAVAYQTLGSGIKDPDGEKKRLVLEMTKLGITVEMVNIYFGNSTWSTEELVELQGIVTAIRDGAAKRDDYFAAAQEVAKGGLSTADMKEGDAKNHQGFNDKPSEPQSDKPKANKDGGLF